MRTVFGGPRGTVYYNIQMHPLSLSEREVAQGFDQSRFDPRLMEIMTEFIRDFWWSIDPTETNKACKKSRSPFMLKTATSVILDFCEMTKNDRLLFSDWVKLASRGLQDPAPQLLFVGVIPVASNLIQDEIKGALPSFLKHNLIAKDLPFNKGKPGALKTELNPAKNKVDEIDLLKFKLARKLRAIKMRHGLSNDEMIRLSSINRVFLSKILNHKLEHISVEYLITKTATLERFKK